MSEIGPLLQDLQQLQADLASDLKLPAAEEWIELYLFHDKATYDRYLGRHFPRVPYRRALYIKSSGQGRLFAYRGSQFEVDLRHECTHALLHAVLPMVPLWLDEGLAEYYELPPGKRVRGNPHQDGLSWAIRLGTLPKLEGLEKKTSLPEMGGAEYRAAWAWVHFLLHNSPETRELLIQYLTTIRMGHPPGPLSQRLRSRVPEAETRFVGHWQSWAR